MSRSLSAPSIIRRETPENVPALVQPETPPLVLPNAINPQQTRRGFLGTMGNIAARLAMPRSRLAEVFTGPQAREDIIRRELERYSNDFGELNNYLMATDGNVTPSTLGAAYRRLLRIDPNAIPESAEHALGETQYMPHSVSNFGEDMARSIARRSGQSEAEVRRVLGSDPSQYERYLAPMTHGMDDLEYPEQVITDSRHNVSPREQLIRSHMPEDTTFTPQQMERLWSRAPELDYSVGPQGMQRHLDSFEPWLHELEARDVARLANRPYVAETPGATAYSVPPHPYSEGVESHAMMPSRGAGPGRVWAWNVPDAESDQIRFLESQGLMAPRGALRAPTSPASVSPARGPMRPMTIDQEGNMIESPWGDY